MPPSARDTTTYSGNRADGDSTNTYGNVYGGVHLTGRSSAPGEPAANRCLRDLQVTDPREDRARIEGDKDRLLRDCYAWILDDASFQQWRTQDASRLLWIKGDPGKGKTMMTMGVIDELSQSMPLDVVATKRRRLNNEPPSLLSFFFCQNTVPGLNDALSILRGLVYMLVDQRRDLLRFVQQRYETVGKRLFEGFNAIYTLRQILSEMLDDASLPPTYLLVDALDECTSGLPELLRIITDDNIGRRSRVKWLVTSRNIPDIERYLQPDPLGVKVSLEVKASYVSRAVATFVEDKVQRLVAVQKYDSSLQADVQRQLRDKADGTFLWVSLVCKELEKVPLYRTREVLQALPPGLDPLYDRMMAQIEAQDARTADYCKRVLRAVTIAFRPLRLKELVVVSGLPSDQFHHFQAVADLVSYCGSFLTIHQDAVSFVHLSAKDYLMSSKGWHVFDGTAVEEHRRLTYRLLNAMRNLLQRDICGLEKTEAQTEELAGRMEDSVLAQIAYACEYWVDHLCESNIIASEDVLQDSGAVDLFLREKFLYWLEALSLCKSMSKGIISIEKLWSLTQVSILITIVAKTVKLTEAREEKKQARLLSLSRMRIVLRCIIRELLRSLLCKRIGLHYCLVQGRV
jgi:hypothetical protein